MTETVDFYASERHLFDHLLPIWQALPDGARHKFLAGAGIAGYARTRGVDVDIAQPGSDRARLVVVASYGDEQRSGRDRVVLLEHGAGQDYRIAGTLGHRAEHAGGPGRERVRLFLCPNQLVADRNRAVYPAADVAVVGCPKLDPWHLLPPTRWTPESGRPPVVAISFHWPCTVVPECGNAWDHYRPALHRLARAFPGALGHAHPRFFPTAAPIFERAGLEPVADFADVLDRADVYACDNSSTIFEFASTGRPVVVLNAPWYRRDVNHGLRFWDAADVGINVDEPGDLLDAVAAALADPPDVAARRHLRVGSVYAHRDGSAARRAAEAIMALITSQTSGRPNQPTTEETPMGPANFRVHRVINGHPTEVAVTEAELTPAERRSFGLDRPPAEKARTAARNKARNTAATKTTNGPAEAASNDAQGSGS